ncbi:MAG: hypothetical protein VYE18_08310 [Pseudomonadota bacterium]|nr:hypothetical protein [Pseudomonadota bacterium]
MNKPPQALVDARTLLEEGNLAAAILTAKNILASNAEEAGALHLLGLAANTAGKPQEAVAYYGRALLSAPSDAAVHTDLAAAYLTLGAAGNAEAHARRATFLDPGFGTAHYNLGNALFALGDATGAADSFAAAIETEPENDLYWSNHLFSLNFSAEATPAEISKRNRAWGAMVEAGSGDIGARPVAGPGAPLTLAYYLPELDTHVTPRFLEPVLHAHDKDSFRVCVFGSQSGGGRPEFVPEDCDWVDVGGQPDEEVAAGMRAACVHILIHPCTFKARYRRLLACRPAPVQIAAINLVSSTGLKAVDYLLTTEYLDPSGTTEQFYTEELIRLPSFNTYRILETAPPIGPLPAAANGCVTFGSLNNPAKLSPGAIAVWSRILRRLPGSRLLLKHRALDDIEVANRFVTCFKDAGIGEERIELDGFTPSGGSYLATYSRIDMALDPFPFGGGTTSYEALWMGVPVLALAGETFMGRLTAALMGQLGLDDWVASDTDGYMEAALTLAADLQALADLRANLRERARTSIFDAAAFTRSLEDAGREAWRRHQENS